MIILENIVRTYREKGARVEALKGVSLHVEKGGFMAVTGESGSGKTTLMNIAGCMSRPDSGRYILDGRDVTSLSPSELSQVRNRKIGFIFQSFNLISNMTALENVMLPLAIRGVPREERLEAADRALKAVGLGNREKHLPGRLSGGQRQRVAAARVIACGTPVILADEPTGNLDPQAASEIADIFFELNAGGVTVLMITHDEKLAQRALQRARMTDGRLEMI